MAFKKIIKKKILKKKTLKTGKTIKSKTKKVKTKLPEKLIKYLETAAIDHKILEHRTVYTAYDAAATMRKKLNEIAKSLLIAADKDYYIVILPADQNLDFNKLNAFLTKQFGKKIKVVKIPGEKIMEDIFKVKAGTLSAFGKLHNLPVVMDKTLAKVKQAIFSSGSFNHSVFMAVKDFTKLENAVIGSFGVKKKIKAQKVIKPKKLVNKNKSKQGKKKITR
jgi:Ala-tRNA(Pro) deacylase